MDAMNHSWFDEINKQNPEETALASSVVAVGLPEESQAEIRQREREAKQNHDKRSAQMYGPNFEVQDLGSEGVHVPSSFRESSEDERGSIDLIGADAED